MKIELHTNENAVPLILYPGKKLEYIEPTLEMLNILKKSLLNVKYCFIIGYAFKDEHILKLFLYAANKNLELVLFLISPSAHAIYYEKLKDIPTGNSPIRLRMKALMLVVLTSQSHQG